MLVVNLFGGPGSGKSTMAADIFASLKHQGVNCELVREFAKDMVWSKRLPEMRDQIYLLGEQHHRLWVLKDQVDVVVTDSPLLQSLPYAYAYLPWGIYDSYKELTLNLHDQYFNYNLWVTRCKDYNPAGRTQTEEEAVSLDIETGLILDEQQIYTHNVTPYQIPLVLDGIIRRLPHDNMS